ncbi:Ubiquitin-associated/translation elongation factor EF1B protein [Euphorbia peplus]|nr:Ubiquitin-associated/translation elongation factor EF1B protein [Euphorbia peplus]
MDHSPESTGIRYLSSYYHTSPPAPFSPGLGIRVALKPDLRMMTCPPRLAQVRDIPRANFEFDFELERKILAELKTGRQNSSGLGLENLPSKTAESTPSPGPSADPATSQTRNYGDDSTNVVLQYSHSPPFNFCSPFREVVFSKNLIKRRPKRKVFRFQRWFENLLTGTKC